ncbi:RICIN domain-containing protein [Micromonospora sp. NPDC001898]|uniref:RICIN domain-containing protein n=1 Tax=Micromonospora sp. NPDC001898 TaxID=3364221 RepID=UPI00368A0B3F
MTTAGADLRPDQAGTTAEFLALLRELKDRSGHTYRELERRAAARGDVLPRSTTAAALRGNSPPRAELLDALVRACGAEEHLRQWRCARDRLDAAGEQPGQPVPPGKPPPGPPAPPAGDRPDPAPDDGPTATTDGRSGGYTRRRTPAARWWPAGRWFPPPLVTPLLASLLAIGVGALLATTSARDTWPDPTAITGRASTGTAVRQAPPLPTNLLREVRIRPVTAPDLCLTDGRVLDRRYTPLVAVQRSCGEVWPQTTVLQPTEDGTYRIRWDHPDYGPGCLVGLTAGPGAGLLEPWDDCVRGSRFRIEPSGSYDSNTYVLRLPGQGCVGISDSGTTVGTEAVLGRCVGRGGQVFRIEPAPPPGTG